MYRCRAGCDQVHLVWRAPLAQRLLPVLQVLVVPSRTWLHRIRIGRALPGLRTRLEMTAQETRCAASPHQFDVKGALRYGSWQIPGGVWMVAPLMHTASSRCHADQLVDAASLAFRIQISKYYLENQNRNYFQKETSSPPCDEYKETISCQEYQTRIIFVRRSFLSWQCNRCIGRSVQSRRQRPLVV